MNVFHVKITEVNPHQLAHAQVDNTTQALENVGIVELNVQLVQMEMNVPLVPLTEQTVHQPAHAQMANI